jgi:hypothetical protein
MNEWALFGTVVTVVIALLGLLRMASNDMLSHIAKEFEDAEERRVEASAVWQERLATRDDQIRRLWESHARLDQEHRVCGRRTRGIEVKLEGLLRTVEGDCVMQKDLIEHQKSIRSSVADVAAVMRQMKDKMGSQNKT